MASVIPDDFRINAAKENWQLQDCAQLETHQTIEADVIIIGTGAGGGVSAEVLSQAGLNVVMIEEGNLHTSTDFKMDELDSYGKLYQEGAGRATKDGAINIFQGRTVGGTTAVNWTSSFRTPNQTLEHWQNHHSVMGCSPEEMQPFFEKMEQRLNIEKWAAAPNMNNDILKRGCEKNGWSWGIIPRNVKGCMDLGFCGMGCPANAKQSMLITTVPAALKNGAQLFYRCSAHTLDFSEHKVESVTCHALGTDNKTPTGIKLTFKAPHIVLAGGAINNPGLLKRSNAPDPYDRIGKRTTIHPVNATLAQLDETIDPFYGAPQSIYSDHFQWSGDAATAQNPAGHMGFKLEVPPMHPVMGAQIMGFHGLELADTVNRLPNLQGTLALMRDGFHEDSPGGNVELDHGGKPILDYKISDYLWDGMRKSYHAMVEIQFAAGAKKVMPVHHDGKFYDNLKDCKQAIDHLDMTEHRARIMTAHLMGGCAMGENAEISVVNSQAKFHQADNLYVIDGSLFPTSIGANPQLSIYGMALKQATALVQTIKG